MKKIALLTLIAAAISITGCNNKRNQPDDEDKLKDDEVRVRLPHNMNDKAQDYDVIFRFDDAFFKEDAKTFNQELALLSLGNTFCSANSIYVGAFYQRLQFDTNVKYVNYSITATENTVAYSIAHKKIDNFDLLAITVRGFDYGKEWANNFYLGETGNHAGFQARADEIYADLKSEISSHNYENLKLWITGYSRGGGISNVLSHQILSSDEINIAQENMFVYTFEAPRGLLEENAIPYPNVHNVINNADLITYAAPVQYGLYRCGVDVQIYSESSNLGRLLYDLDEDISFPTFTPKEGDYENQQQFIEYIFNQITREITDEDEKDKSAHTRQDFVNNYQDGITYLVGLFFTLDNSTVNKMTTAIDEMTITQKLSLAATDGIYNFVKPILDEDHVSYDDETLHASCNVATKFLQSNVAVAFALFNNMDNAKHVIYMHMPEAEYVLLKDLKIL